MGHLINLLAATHSFLSGRMPSGRFQMREEYLLPKFNQDRPDPLPSAVMGVAAPSGAASGAKSGLRLFGGRPLRTPTETASRLEKVKVVRNDLADADIEVAPQGMKSVFAEERPRERKQDPAMQFSQAAVRLLDKFGI